MKKITIIEMGGTISARGQDRLDLKDYTSGIYKGETFLQEIPELAEIAEVSFDPLFHVSSTEIAASHWISLRERIIYAFNEEKADGVVITHGTNTLEETAYFLHLTIPSDKPVVLVGAQRPFTAISSDAQLNLLSAVRVAKSNEAMGRGVLVMLNDEISSAREATKTNTYRVEAFQSGQLGFLGYVSTDKEVHFYRDPTRKHTVDSEFSSCELTQLDEVEIVYSYAGATNALINFIIDCGKYRGIVTAGTGAGLSSPSELRGLKRATEAGIFVVRSSRVGNGRVVPIKTYENYPFISGDNLLPQKARILLMLALQKYDTVKEIQHVFTTY